jgi:hypothetical protein
MFERVVAENGIGGMRKRSFQRWDIQRLRQSLSRLVNAVNGGTPSLLKGGSGFSYTSDGRCNGSLDIGR